MSSMIVPTALAEQVSDELGLLSSREVCRRSGITYRRLDTWTRTGKIVPVVGAAGSGSARLFDPSVLDEIADLLARIGECPLHHHEAQHERPRRP